MLAPVALRLAIAGAYSVAAYFAWSASGIPPKATPVPRLRAELSMFSLATPSLASACAIPASVSPGIAFKRALRIFSLVANCGLSSSRMLAIERAIRVSSAYPVLVILNIPRL